MNSQRERENIQKEQSMTDRRRKIPHNSAAYVEALSTAGINLEEVIETPLETGIPIHTGRGNVFEPFYLETTLPQTAEDESARTHQRFWREKFNGREQNAHSISHYPRAESLEPQSKLELLVARLWLGETIENAIRLYYQGRGSTVLQDLTNITVNAESLGLRSLAARSQLWKAIILHDMEDTAQIPELLADVIWLVATHAGQEADYYQLRKMLSKYSEETWQHLKLIDIHNKQANNDLDSNIDFYSEQAQSQYDSWFTGMRTFLDARFNRNEWPDPEDAMAAATTRTSQLSRKAWSHLQHRLNDLTEHYELLLIENRRLKGDVPDSQGVSHFADNGQNSGLQDHQKISPREYRDNSVCDEQSLQESDKHQTRLPIDNSVIDQQVGMDPSLAPAEQTSRLVGKNFMSSPDVRHLTRWMASNHNVGLQGGSGQLTAFSDRSHWGAPRILSTADWSDINRTPSSWLPSSSSIRNPHTSQSSDWSSMRRFTPPKPLRIRKRNSKLKARAKQSLSEGRRCSKHRRIEKVQLREKSGQQLGSNPHSETSVHQLLTESHGLFSDTMNGYHLTASPGANIRDVYDDKLRLTKSNDSSEFEGVFWQNSKHDSRMRTESEAISPHTRPKQVGESHAGFNFDLSRSRSDASKRVPYLRDHRQMVPSPTRLVSAITENDVPLTDTPSPTKLEEHVPHLREHQEQRRRSETYPVTAPLSHILKPTAILATFDQSAPNYSDSFVPEASNTGTVKVRRKSPRLQVDTDEHSLKDLSSETPEDESNGNIQSQVSVQEEDSRSSSSLGSFIHKLQGEQAADVGRERRASKPSISSPLRQSTRISDDDNEDSSKDDDHGVDMPVDFEFSHRVGPIANNTFNDTRYALRPRKPFDSRFEGSSSRKSDTQPFNRKHNGFCNISGSQDPTQPSSEEFDAMPHPSRDWESKDQDPAVQNYHLAKAAFPQEEEFDPELGSTEGEASDMTSLQNDIKKSANEDSDHGTKPRRTSPSVPPSKDSQIYLDPNADFPPVTHLRSKLQRANSLLFTRRYDDFNTSVESAKRRRAVLGKAKSQDQPEDVNGSEEEEEGDENDDRLAEARAEKSGVGKNISQNF